MRNQNMGNTLTFVVQVVFCKYRLYLLFFDLNKRAMYPKFDPTRV